MTDDVSTQRLRAKKNQPSAQHMQVSFKPLKEIQDAVLSMVRPPEAVILLAGRSLMQPYVDETLALKSEKRRLEVELLSNVEELLAGTEYGPSLDDFKPQTTQEKIRNLMNRPREDEH